MAASGPPVRFWEPLNYWLFKNPQHKLLSTIMPRTGGESDKLGNRYEGVWTVDSLLDVLAGEALSVTVEPIGEDSRGIEFFVERVDGQKKFHSAKRQTTGTSWTLFDLTVEGPLDSILGQLFAKLDAYPNCRVLFVSATTPNELNELTEQAGRTKTFKTFSELLDTAGWRRKKFDEYLLPLCGGKAELVFERLTRTEVVGITERELTRRVEQRIRAELYRPDGTEVDAHAARLLIADIVFDWFAQPLTRSVLLEYLEEHGYRERDLSRDKTVLEAIESRNASYTRHVEAELIEGTPIERAEAKAAYCALTEEAAKRRIVIVGSAGFGKSCAMAQTVRRLTQDRIPVIAVRLDIQTQALTSDALGKHLGLPVSPAIVLARVARGKRCVLVIDQLDALSLASGRNQHLWDPFDEMLREADQVPNMRVLLACRAFDVENDYRLRRLISDGEKTLRIDLGLLDIEFVKQTVTKATGSIPRLAIKQLQILQTPLHLSIYLQGNPKSESPFETVQDLFSRYWTRKRQSVATQLGREPRWTEVIDALATWLSDHQTLSAPTDILDEWEGDARAMASHYVLVMDAASCRFFHESFFDYSFARSFVAAGGKVCDLLLKQNVEQHLFRRAQVRQILAYQRGRDVPNYLSELRELLKHSEVRFHIKKLALDWLRSLDQPTADEWRLLQEFDGDPKLGRFVRLVPHNSPAWFAVLVETGTWNQWLSSSDENQANHAVWLLSLANVMKVASDKVAALVSPHLDGSDLWRKRFIHLVSFGDVHYSREMFDLFLRGLRAGWIDDAHKNWWDLFHEMAHDNPSFAVELVAVFLEHLIQRARDLNPFDIIREDRAFSERFLHSLESNCPDEEIIRRLLPIVVATIQRNEFIHEDGEIDDHFDVFHATGEHGFKATLFGCLRRSLARLAVANPENLERLTVTYEMLPHRTVAVLLLSAWGANGRRFADKAAAYLIANRYRLGLGYCMWSGGGGDGRCAIARATLSAIAPHCSEGSYNKLEKAVLAFLTPAERENMAFRGYPRLLLLDALPRERMSLQAIMQLEQLRTKFPDADFSPPREPEVYSVGSPISNGAMEKMTDEQWLSAMRKYSRERIRTPENLTHGGIHELASELVQEAQANKPRFAALALRIPDEIAPRYLDAILDGIAETHGELPEDRKVKAVAPQALGTETLFDVIRHVHGLPGHPCGRTICSAIYRLADRIVPDEAYDILTHYALKDPDPDKEWWRTPASNGTQFYGGDPASAGRNSVRGGAASTIAQLLFRDEKRWPKVEATVRALAVDRSLAVRAVTAECVLAFLNHDRDEAVSLFLTLLKGADAILGIHSVDQFLHHAGYSHYTQIRPVLLQMLTLSDEKARSSAARQISVASFADKQAEEDLKAGLTGDEHCRKAAANVFAHNLGLEPIRAVCGQRLLPLFNDESKEVREATQYCFRQLSAEQLLAEKDLINAFIESRAFADGFDQLVFALKHSTALLPDVTCAIPEKVIATHLAESPNESLEQRRNVYELPELVIRLYEQTVDGPTKTRCLNLIDSMMEIGISSLESELQKLER